MAATCAAIIYLENRSCYSCIMTLYFCCCNISALCILLQRIVAQVSYGMNPCGCNHFHRYTTGLFRSRSQGRPRLTALVRNGL